MTKAKYEVVRPWHGVTQGEVIELDDSEIHPSLKSNIRKLISKPEDGDFEAQGQAIIDKAKAEADKIIEDAKAEAERIKGHAANPGTLTVNPADRKELIKAKLAEHGIDFDGRKGEAELFKLLPAEEQEKLGA